MRRQASTGRDLPSILRRNGWVLLLTVAVLAMTVALVVRLPADARAAAPSTVAAGAPTTKPVAGPPPCAHNAAPKLIRVSLSEQRMWLCAGAQQVSTSPVTTGSVDHGHGTPTGNWTIVSHESDRYLTGPGYRVHVQYWLPFFGDFGFHDSPWQKIPYGDPTGFRTAGSQGCVHVPGPAMAALYRWSSVGTAVTVVA